MFLLVIVIISLILNIVTQSFMYDIACEKNKQTDEINLMTSSLVWRQ